MFAKDRVDIAFLEERNARWEFAGRGTLEATLLPPIH